MDANEILRLIEAWARDWQVASIVAGVVINAVLGVALSIRMGTFALRRVFEWLWHDIVPLVLSYLVLRLFATWIDLPVAADIVLVGIITNLSARIVEKLKALGIANG